MVHRYTAFRIQTKMAETKWLSHPWETSNRDEALLDRFFGVKAIKREEKKDQEERDQRRPSKAADQTKDKTRTKELTEKPTGPEDSKDSMGCSCQYLLYLVCEPQAIFDNCTGSQTKKKEKIWLTFKVNNFKIKYHVKLIHSELAEYY